jgi:hypothetical protein
MVRIAITQAAFEAIARTLPVGSVGYEAEVNEQGQLLAPMTTVPWMRSKYTSVWRWLSKKRHCQAANKHSMA